MHKRSLIFLAFVCIAPVNGFLTSPFIWNYLDSIWKLKNGVTATVWFGGLTCTLGSTLAMLTSRNTTTLEDKSEMELNCSQELYAIAHSQYAPLALTRDSYEAADFCPYHGTHTSECYGEAVVALQQMCEFNERTSNQLKLLNLGKGGCISLTGFDDKAVVPKNHHLYFYSYACLTIKEDQEREISFVHAKLNFEYSFKDRARVAPKLGENLALHANAHYQLTYPNNPMVYQPKNLEKSKVKKSKATDQTPTNTNKAVAALNPNE